VAKGIIAGRVRLAGRGGLMSDSIVKPQRGRVPNYVVVLLLVGVTAGGAGLVWNWMHRDRVAPDVMEFDGSSRKELRRGHGGLVMKDKEGAIRLVTAGVELRLTAAAAGKKGELHLRALGMDNLITPQQEQTIRAMRRLVGASALVKRLNITAEQIQKLKQVPLDWELKLADADRAKLETMCAAWDKAQGAAKVTAETELVGALREIGPKAVASAKQTLAKNTELARGVLTPQQWQQYQEWTTAKAPAKVTPAANKEAKAVPAAPAVKQAAPAVKKTDAGKA
jgi:hypothetical protein